MGLDLTFPPILRQVAKRVDVDFCLRLYCRTRFFNIDPRKSAFIRGEELPCGKIVVSILNERSYSYCGDSRRQLNTADGA
jgi:hypothetical protein